MLQQALHRIELQTRGRALYEFTDRVQQLVAESGLVNGCITLLVQHTSASLLIRGKC